ncbi:MAG: hypothetical protein ACOC0R_04200 [Mariniphaga sp.]
MKKIISGLSGIIVISLLYLSSCTTPAIEAAREAYDYNAIVPKVLSVDAPASVVQTQAADVKVGYHRGGSKWNWSADGASIQSVSEDTKTATVLFDQAPASGVAKLTVTETTMGGITSEPFTVEVSIEPFCALSIDLFTGAFICNEEGYGEYPVTFTTDPEVQNRILNSNFWDWPAEGEVIYYDLSGDIDQIVTVPKQSFTFGDGTVGSVEGSGVYDSCTRTMTVDYSVEYGGDVSATHHEFKVAE